MNKNTIAAVLLIVGLGAGFFGGMQYQKSKAPTTQAGQLGGAGRGSFQGRNGGGRVVGKIISSDNKAITVKLQDGSSKIVLLTSSVTINKAATGSVSDLQTGTTVAVFGSTNSDGSVTAQNVQINPMMRPGGSASPQPQQQ